MKMKKDRGETIRDKIRDDINIRIRRRISSNKIETRSPFRPALLNPFLIKHEKNRGRSHVFAHFVIDRGRCGAYFVLEINEIRC